MKLSACAKINWTLDITGQRQDGYHLMDMLMQPVTLCDEVELLPADEISLSVEGNPEISSDKSNLAWRAAEALRQVSGTSFGASIHIVKKIPSQAGLGGGSADAAAVLHGLNLLWNTGFSQEELEQIGLTLGADVPFCLRGGFCRVQGIGEILTPLPDAPERTLLILQPCAGLSTKAVFQAYHAADRIRHPDTDSAIAKILEGDSLTDDALGNVMQQVSADMRPEIPEAIALLKEYGAECAQMSGSGSAVFGVFTDDTAASLARSQLLIRYHRVWLCHTCLNSLPVKEEPSCLSI